MSLRIAAAALAIGLCTAGVAQADDQPQAGQLDVELPRHRAQTGRVVPT